VSRWAISRRELLARLGLGAACLPLLQATKSYGQPAVFPKRFICHLQTEGYRMPAWLPAAGSLAAQTLPDSTSPLEPWKNQLIFLANLTNPRYPGCDRWGHGTYGQIFTAGAVDPNTGTGKEYWEPTVMSVDQVIGNTILNAVPDVSRATLPLEIRVGGGSYPGSKRCFWSGPKQPVTPEPDPYRVYAQVFAGAPAGMGDPAATKMLAARKSLLDYVGHDLERFAKRLGTEDQQVIAGHLQSVRNLEKQLAGRKGTIDHWTGEATMPIDIRANANVPLLLTLHYELMVAALKSDVTRVGTMQLGDATGGAIVFDFVPGVPRLGNGYQPFRDWHDLGHQPVRAGVPDGDDKARVDKWTMGRFADLLKLLASTPEGAGSMLDNTLVLWANHMEDGENHGAQKVPWILAGNCQGYFKTGQCLPNSGRAINAVMTEICNAMDVKVDAFNDPVHGKPMPELRA
jgi:hypothetical protein